MFINNSKNKITHEQRDNKFVWVSPKNSALKTNALTMCNGTSLCMQYKYNYTDANGCWKQGYGFPTGRFEQPEDNFVAFIYETPECIEYYKKISPQYYAEWEAGKSTAYNPNEIHDVLRFSFNKWVGKDIDKFKVDWSITDIFNELKAGRTVTCSGAFPYKNVAGKQTTLNHINVLVGYEEVDGEIARLLVDDPYGSVHQNFAAGTGDNVIITVAEFAKWYKPVGNAAAKFAHIMTA
jgi:hypothetical protein